VLLGLTPKICKSQLLLLMFSISSKYSYASFVSVQADFAKLPADFIIDGTGMPSR